MSQTNDTASICNRCKSLVPVRQGTIRVWNGAARKYAPKYATRSAYGILGACRCNKCERELGY